MTFYQFKNLKTLNAREGIAYTATIYRDGKRVGTAEDLGDGGAAWVYWDDKAESDAFCAWTLEHAEGFWIDEFVNREEPGCEHNEELGLNLLFETYDLVRLSKKNLVFRLSEEDVRTVKNMTGEEATAYVASKYPTAQIFEPAALKWYAIGK